MTWKGRYSPEPLNDADGSLSGDIDERIRLMLSSTAASGSYAPGSIPQSAVRTPVVTDLPVEAQDGDEVYYYANADNSVIWHFRFRAKSPSLYRWEFMGGTEYRAENTGTSMTTTSTSYTDLSTVGPTITVPLAGDYRIEWWSQGQNNTGASVNYMGIKVGSATTADTDAVRGQPAANNYDHLAPVGSRDFNVPAAGTVVKAQYRANAGTLTVNNAGTINPWMTVRPIRVGRV